MSQAVTPGAIVRLPGRPDWGLGRVQTAIGDRVTVNFEHGGKQVIDTRVAPLELVEDD
jgi:hypothetical protein